MSKVGILGFGTWGKAMTKVLHDSSNEVLVYTRQNFNQFKDEYLPISFANNLSEVISFADFAVIATKANEVEDLVNKIKAQELMIKNCIITSKGLNNDGQLLSGIIYDIVRDQIGVLAGPNFANEIMADKLTLSTLSSNIPDIFSNDRFKIESCDDVIGLQVCSVMKNIYAIGCGIVVSTFNSENTKAAFLTIAFHELFIAIELFGGVRATAYTAAGLGDLVLTCYSTTSRNHMFGEMFTRGIINNDITVEGYSSIMKMRSDIRDKLPLCNSIYKLLTHKINLEQFKMFLINY
jgi:glycerol-3-phosphate dehydrogenase (NAD(P)+)